MLEEIRRLEEISRELEPDSTERARLTSLVTGYAEGFLESIPQRAAYVDRHDVPGAFLNSPVQEQGTDLSTLLAEIDKQVDSVGLNPTSGRFLGYIPGGALYPSALGDYLAAVTNRYAGYFFASPGAVRIENQLLDWMSEIVGYPTTAAGNLASGGTYATLIAVMAARDSCGIEGPEIERSVIYQTEQVHHCVNKVLAAVGLRRCPIRNIGTDDTYRMDVNALRAQIAEDRAAGLKPWLLVASAGTTNSGSIDPLADLASVAEENQLWYHIDAAYGGFFILCPEVKDQLSAMNRSDSLVMDPHKSLFLPYGTGAVLVKDRKKLRGSNEWSAEYIQDFPDELEELSPAELSPELTKHYRGLRLWLPLRLFGVARFRAALSEKLLLARYAHQKLSEIPGMEMGPFPDLSVVMFRYIPKKGNADSFNEALVQALLADGRIFISSTRVGGKFVLRFGILCFRTHRAEIDEAIRVVQETAQRLGFGSVDAASAS